MGAINISSVGKIYPNGTRALEDVNIEINDGEFLVLVGPSGCGKTTLLRMVAGLEDITEGEISSTIKLQAGSGKSVRIFFCNKCGSYIYTDYESAIGRLNVRTKTLEKSEEFPPQAHIFTKDKDEWVNLSNINNCFEKMYDPKETWPKESIIRIKEYLNTKK